MSNYGIILITLSPWVFENQDSQCRRDTILICAKKGHKYFIFKMLKIIYLLKRPGNNASLGAKMSLEPRLWS
jgi:hypothetical protein